MECSDHTLRQKEVDDFIMIEHVEHEQAPEHLDAISQAVEELNSDLRTISLDIHDTPELQYKEFHAHKILTEYLSKQEGWVVTPSAYDIKTAFVAVYDSGSKGPVVSFNAEYGVFISILKLPR